MSVVDVKVKGESANNVCWKTLISDAEARLEILHEEVRRLNKSIIFFKKQEDIGVPFPQTKRAKSEDLS